MSLKEKLKDAAINHLKHVYDSTMLMTKLTIVGNSSTLRMLYEEKIINDAEIQEALDYAVCKRAKLDLEFLLKKDKERPKYAYHDVSDNAFFAYALEKGIFLEKEIKMIPFDGDTVESYCNLYGNKNLLTDLKDRHLNILKPILPPYDSNDNLMIRM